MRISSSGRAIRSISISGPNRSISTGRWCMNTRPRLEKAWNATLDIIYPPRCGGCNARGVLFCAECSASVEVPADDELHLNQLNALACAGVFRGPLRNAIHNFKYEGDTTLAAPLAGLLAATLSSAEHLHPREGEQPVL